MPSHHRLPGDGSRSEREPATVDQILVSYGQYAIETFLRQAPMLHIYELGDLDPAMQRHVRWFSRGRDGLPDAVALRFDGLSTPTLIALAHDDLDALRVLVKTIDMPHRYYAHVTPGLQNVLAGVHKPLGRYLKMGLPRGTPLGPLEAVIRFGPADADALLAFYREAYPGNHFENSSLGVGPYVGLRAKRGIIAAAGVHVYSELQRVAALGNIATHPEHRGNGLGKIVTRGLVQLLAPHVDVIGLNVRADNAPAIACYESIGFRVIGVYDELLVER
jgi:ribosomal protein S18 acetylase RimI-like enzyme